MSIPVTTVYFPNLTVYFVIYSEDGKIWNISILENFNQSHWLNYCIPMTEISSGTYSANFPSIPIAGSYSVIAYSQIGASPDYTNDEQISMGSIVWDGQSEIELTQPTDVVFVNSQETEVVVKVPKTIDVSVSVKSNGFTGLTTRVK